MPYTKTPTTDTYSQEDISLVREVTSRQNDPLGLKDEALINTIVEIVKDKRTRDDRTFHYKRAGSSVYLTNIGTVRGSFMWKDKWLFAYCVGDDVFLYNTNTGTTTTCNTVFSTSSGRVGFTLFLYETGEAKLVATDGTTVVTITDAGVVAPSTSPDLPTPHVPSPIFLDGYLYLLEENTANIWNSDLDDPLLYTAGSFLNAEIEGDFALDIAKLNNYIVVFGSKTIEYLYDAGVETGSPLKRNDTPVKLNGFMGGISHAGNAIYFYGYNESQQAEVYKLQDFQMEAISTPTMRRYASSSGNTTDEFYGCLVSNLGHDFYFINGDSRSFVFDIKERLWGQWNWKTNSTFKILHANNIVSPNGVYSVFQIDGDTNLYRFNDTVYQDAGTNFDWVVITEPSDFGTMYRKSMSKLALVCDRPTATSYMYVSFSDDDFQSWYGNYPINLNQDLPNITRLGNFRQRAVKLKYTDNYPMRVQKIQVDINKGRN